MANLPKLRAYLESDNCKEKTYKFSNKHAKINNATNISDLIETAYKKHLDA